MFGTIFGEWEFQKPELIAGLLDQLRQPFSWTDAVFAGLGHRSGGLFWRLGMGPHVSKVSLKYLFTRLRPNWITGPGPKSGSAEKSESSGPENGVSRWRRPNTDIYSQSYHFGLVYDVIYQFLGMEAKNFKFGMFWQQCHPSVAPGDADIRPRNAYRIHTCHLFTS